MFSARAPLTAGAPLPEAFTSSCCSRSSAFSEDDQEQTCVKHLVFLQFPQCTWSNVTLGRLSADSNAVLYAALADVLHQDLHQHCKVFFSELHLPDTAQLRLDSAEFPRAAAVAAWHLPSASAGLPGPGLRACCDTMTPPGSA